MSEFEQDILQALKNRRLEDTKVRYFDIRLIEYRLSRTWPGGKPALVKALDRLVKRGLLKKLKFGERVEFTLNS